MLVGLQSKKRGRNITSKFDEFVNHCSLMWTLLTSDNSDDNVYGGQFVFKRKSTTKTSIQLRALLVSAWYTIVGVRA